MQEWPLHLLVHGRAAGRASAAAHVLLEVLGHTREAAECSSLHLRVQDRARTVQSKLPRSSLQGPGWRSLHVAKGSSSPHKQ